MKHKLKSKTNNFDLLIEDLVNEFIKIPNFDLTQHDQTAKHAFNTITFRIADIASYKELVCNHFIPETNKAIYRGKQMILTSKYRTFMDVKNLDFNETLYDTIRLAYVGLFHKIESFINDLINMVDLVCKLEKESSQNINQWVKAKYKIDFKDWQQFYIIHKINWICNCVKHKDGYPLKEPKPIGFDSLNPNEKIRISTDEFKKDCESLMKFYPHIIKLMMTFGLARLMLETVSEPDDIPEIQKIRDDSRIQIEEKLNQMVNLFKLQQS